MPTWMCCTQILPGRGPTSLGCAAGTAHYWTPKSLSPWLLVIEHVRRTNRSSQTLGLEGQVQDRWIPGTTPGETAIADTHPISQLHMFTGHDASLPTWYNEHNFHRSSATVPYFINRESDLCVERRGKPCGAFHLQLANLRSSTIHPSFLPLHSHRPAETSS